jgi:hypothetical protein
MASGPSNSTYRAGLCASSRMRASERDSSNRADRVGRAMRKENAQVAALRLGA